MQDGLVTIDHDEAFSYIAFLGGSTGPGSSGDESAFAVRPVSLVAEPGVEAGALEEPDAETLDWSLGEEEPAVTAEDDGPTLYRLGEDGSLDLRDLLQEWDGDSDSLVDFLQASADEAGNTLLHVSSDGVFGDGDLEAADQVFLLEGVAYHDGILQQLLDDEELDIE
nr:type I secretion C-terminal target domain-containing protein [Halomonas campaniensis]